MGEYDHILKQNIHEIFPDLCKIQLGIDYATGEDIKDKISTTIEREADFLQIVTTTNGEQLIVHLEFQTTDDLTMIGRMHFYWVMLQQKYAMEIRQYVLYIGNQAPQMETSLPPEKQYKGFTLLNLGELSYQHSLASNVPEEVVWAVLHQIDENELEDALRAIIVRLRKLSTPETSFYKYLRQFISFGRLRKFSHIIEELLENMDITYNIKEDAFYQKGEIVGYQKGETVGYQKGETVGYQKGKVEEKLEIAKKLKKQGVSTDTIVATTGLTEEQVEKL